MQSFIRLDKLPKSLQYSDDPATLVFLLRSSRVFAPATAGNYLAYYLISLF